MGMCDVLANFLSAQGLFAFSHGMCVAWYVWYMLMRIVWTGTMSFTMIDLYIAFFFLLLTSWCLWRIRGGRNLHWMTVLMGIQVFHLLYTAFLMTLAVCAYDLNFRAIQTGVPFENRFLFMLFFWKLFGVILNPVIVHMIMTKLSLQWIYYIGYSLIVCECVTLFTTIRFYGQLKDTAHLNPKTTFDCYCNFTCTNKEEKDTEEV